MIDPRNATFKDFLDAASQQHPEYTPTVKRPSRRLSVCLAEARDLLNESLTWGLPNIVLADIELKIEKLKKEGK